MTTSSVNFLKHIYPDGCISMYEPTNIDGHAREFFAWLYEAARIVNFARKIGSQASCYVNGGAAAVQNASQFLDWATLRLSLDGAPK